MEADPEKHGQPNVAKAIEECKSKESRMALASKLVLLKDDSAMDAYSHDLVKCKIP